MQFGECKPVAEALASPPPQPGSLAIEQGDFFSNPPSVRQNGYWLRDCSISKALLRRPNYDAASGRPYSYQQILPIAGLGLGIVDPRIFRFNLEREDLNVQMSNQDVDDCPSHLGGTVRSEGSHKRADSTQPRSLITAKPYMEAEL